MVGAAGDVTLVEAPPAEDGDGGEQPAAAQS
jgi:hypothetical protein